MSGLMSYQEFMKPMKALGSMAYLKPLTTLIISMDEAQLTENNYQYMYICGCIFDHPVLFEQIQ